MSTTTQETKQGQQNPATQEPEKTQQQKIEDAEPEAFGD